MSDQITGFLSPWLRDRRLKMVRPYVQGRVLDYGCGVGVLAEMCKPDFYLGVDIDKESIGIAKRTYPHFRFEYEVPEAGNFDTIVGLAVIEHLSNPVALLEKFKLILEPEGCVVLTTPHPLFRGLHDFGSKIGLFSPDNDEHEQFIDYRLMEEIATRAGLVIKEYKRFLLGANQLFVLRQP
jgi:2-polyprenyl-3-methyl-5-hydroxy-6-metoxy-1,4-benzoquinol methylase